MLPWQNLRFWYIFFINFSCNDNFFIYFNISRALTTNISRKWRGELGSGENDRLEEAQPVTASMGH